MNIGIGANQNYYMSIFLRWNLVMPPTGRGTPPKYILTHYLVWTLHGLLKIVSMHTFTTGAIVRHFKREYITNPQSAEYLYKILAFASHTETGEKLVIYQALYPPYKTCARPYDMFISEVDQVKYPDIKQKYRFEVIETDLFPQA